MDETVFLSYSSREYPAATALCSALEQQGIPCWMAPRDIPPGSSFAAQIVAAIRRSRALVLLASEATNSSGHVLNEVSLAFDAGRPILVWKLEDIPFTPEFQYYLGRSRCIDSTAPQALTQLVQAIGRPVRRRRWPWVAAAAVALAALSIALLLWPRPEFATVRYEDGGSYTGYLLDGECHGTGTMVYGDGAHYTGEWVHGVMNGQGTLTFADGSSYSGGWLQGKMHGKGVYTGADGATLEGSWIQGDMEGEFLLTRADGTRWRVWYQNDEMTDLQAFETPTA